jgi:hypothetical protein
MRTEKLFNNQGESISFKNYINMDKNNVYKKCVNCGLKQIDEFYKMNKKKLCKKCIKVMNKRLYNENKDSYKIKYYRYEKKEQKINLKEEYGREEKTKETNSG